MKKSQGKTARNAPESFDAVPGCPSCGLIMRWSKSAWLMGYTQLWIQAGSLGDVHLMRDHGIDLTE